MKIINSVLKCITILLLISLTLGRYQKRKFHAGRARNSFCDSGKSQSPISLDVPPLQMAVSLMKLQYDNITGNLEWDSNLKTFSINLPNQDKQKYKALMMRRDAAGKVYQKSYSLHRVVVRMLSEHTKIEGKNYPMEIQFFHQKDHGVPGWYARMAFSFFVEPTSEEKEISSLLENIVPGGEVTMKGFAQFNMTPYFYYLGSLPFFPCSQDVNWFVFDNVLKIDKAVYDSLKEIVVQKTGKDHNNRRVQNVAGRKLYKYGN
jgi:carbonic anhydrase